MPIRHIYEQLGGQSMTFAWCCLILVTVLAIKGKLTGEYIAALSIIQGLVVARAAVSEVAQKRRENGHL